MIKLYIIYFALGAYVFLESVVTWVFAPFNDCNDVFTWMALISSAVLFLIATPLLLYKGKMAVKVASISLGGILPFAVYWLTYIYQYESFMRNTENKIILIAAGVYALAIFLTIKYIMQPFQPPVLKTRTKIIVTFLHAGLVIAYFLYFFIR
nr:hypothetical protein [uncultured Mucilaginibacter sp.]